MRKPIIGVMGPGAGATPADIEQAKLLGRRIAQEGWILLSGGRNSGVMDAVNQGAKESGGLTIGIMPTADESMISQWVDIPIITELKSARNTINVLSSDVVIACGMGSGTASEVALALKSQKHVILLNQDEETKAFFKKIGGKNISVVENVEETIITIKRVV